VRIVALDVVRKRLWIGAGLALGVLLMGATSNAASADASATSATGTNEPDLRFVPAATDAFDALGLRPDGLGFRPGPDSPDPTFCKHYQGIARKDAPDGTPYLFVSRSGNVPFPCPVAADVIAGDSPGNLVVVRMGSRDRTGERLRSNRLRRNSAVGYDSAAENTPPNIDDAAVRTITFDGGGDWPAYGSSIGWPAYGHPGAMQVVGDVLAVAMEAPYEGAADAAVMFLDVSDPANPRFLSVMYPGAVTDDFGAGTLGIAPVESASGECCDYLMVVTGKSNKLLKFFKSFPTGGASTTDLTAPTVGWIPVEDYTESELEAPGCLGADWPTASGEGLQSLTFVREADLDGQLYLIGAHNNVAGGLGDDILRLYEVNITSSCPFRQVRSKRVTSYPIHGLEDSANFATGSGAYVSPSGELLFYATDYADIGSIVGPGAWSSFVEYRHRDLVREDSPTLHPTALIDGPFLVDEGSSVALTGAGAPAITQAWIQLFEDTGAGTSVPSQIGGVFDSEWWLAIEYVDRNVDDWGDLDALDHDEALSFDLDFEENAEAWKWWAPPGCTISANDYPSHSPSWPGDSTVILRGTGQVERETDLGDLDVYGTGFSNPPLFASPVPSGTTPQSHDFGDDIEGVTFSHRGADGSEVRDCDGYYDAPISLGWDLNNDGSFETTGTSAPFSALNLDGPSTADVQARAQHPTDTTEFGTGIARPVSIQVRNVAPMIAAASVKDSLGRELAGGATKAIVGLPVELALTFTDPGRADTQAGQVSWSDGGVDTSFDAFVSATNGATGRLEDHHIFTQPGTFTIRATVTDDDGGASSRELTVEVLSLEDAIEHVADELTALIDAATDPRVKAALSSARDELIGNLGGTPPTNGAIDKLEDDDPVGAITKIRAAISYLQTAESRGAGDLSSLKDLLGLVAEGIATSAYTEAQEAASPPSHGEGATLASIADLIVKGHDQLSSGQYLKACDSFRQATQKALDLLS
jgi:hypothetical protein